MNALVPIALFGWIFVVLFLFAMLPAREAVIWAFLTAWLFLPVVHEPVLGIRWTKMRATCYATLLATVLFDSQRFATFKFQLGDLPMLAWCLCPAPSSLVNGLGPYDAFSQSLDQTITWGMPYFIGRVYLGNFEGIRLLTVGFLWGALVYVPLCQIEIRMSPQMHTWVYGYFPHSFAQTIRFGGYRPAVFMEHGLAVGAWMTTASMISLWLWRSRSLSGLVVPYFRYRLSMFRLAGIIGLTAIMCKSSGAIGLEILGIAALFLSAKFKTRIIFIALMCVAPLYVYGRVWGGWSGMDFAEAIGSNFDHDRAMSFVFRLDNENLLIGRAMESPIFGWGGWGRARVYDLDGKDMTVTDGLWIIALGDKGVFGLFALISTLLAPAILFISRYPPELWKRPEYAPAAVMAISLVLYLIDGLANAMVNPVFMLLAGGLTGLTGRPKELTAATETAGPPRTARPRVCVKYPANALATER